MKNINFNLVIITVFILFSNLIIGQTKGDQAQVESSENSYFDVSVNFISDAVFMGRKDSISAPYLYPSFTYHHKSGFYGSSSFSYLTKSDQSRIDLFLFTAGFDFTANKLFGDFSITKYFFNEESFNVISEVEADLTANLSYDFDFINVSVSASTFFNKNSSSDLFLSSELSHDFISNNQQFHISPTAGIYLGSQNFYEEYYVINRLGGDRVSGNGNNTGGSIETVSSVSIQESEKFDVMAIEFSLPMWYTNKNLTFSFLPALVIPQSQANIIVDEELVEEDLKETFYWMVGLSYKFGNK